MSHAGLSAASVQHLRKLGWPESEIAAVAARKVEDPKFDLARELMLEALADGLRRKHPDSIIEIVPDGQG